METKELRLGNLVSFDGRIAIVYQVNRTGAVLQYEGDTNTEIDGIRRSTVSIGDIKPIPLAEDWLIKFGFKKVQEDKYGCHYENEECWIYLNHGGFDLELITDDERFNLLRTYKYVHQLQNLYFAITGKELEAI